MTDGEWLSPAQIAVVLSLRSISGVRAMIRDGRLPARRIRGSRLVRVAREDVEKLLEPWTPGKAPRRRNGEGEV